MTLPTPREVAEQILRDNSELGLTRAADNVLADRQRLIEACLAICEEEIHEFGDPNQFRYRDRYEIIAAIRQLDLTGQ